MSIFKVLLKFADGSEDLDDTEFDSEEAAEEYGLDLIGCSREGAETLNLSNPGDYPLEDYEDPEYEVIEVDD